MHCADVANAPSGTGDHASLRRSIVLDGGSVRLLVNGKPYGPSYALTRSPRSPTFFCGDGKAEDTWWGCSADEAGASLDFSIRFDPAPTASVETVFTPKNGPEEVLYRGLASSRTYEVPKDSCGGPYTNTEWSIKETVRSS